MSKALTDLEVARSVQLKPISEIAKKLGVDDDKWEPYGKYKAKIDARALPETNRNSKLILVTAINPTAAGEGKTTTTIGLGDGLNRLGKQASVCLREPSLGPCFGVKGGAAGGGRAQVGPLEDINLHFTGDFHAITTAHNLLAAVLDNSLHWGNKLNFSISQVAWRRVMDMNERALRSIVVGLGGKTNGVPRESGFDITVASEIMAILCLAKDLDDLAERFNSIVVGYSTSGEMIRAAELKVAGAVQLLLREAIKPNLVQSLEATPALIHGGPFANIAHGCNSLIATNAALHLSDYVVTEAGFGADLGAEKFFDIKCRAGNLQPSAVVVVATVRALKMHGGLAKDKLTSADVTALKAGLTNLGRHLDNLAKFGVPAVVGLNHFVSDTQEELDAVAEFTSQRGVQTCVARHWGEGSTGIEELTKAVIELCDQPSKFTRLYADDAPLLDKISAIATRLYGAERVDIAPLARRRLTEWENAGFGTLPVCMAKTPLSFSADPKLLGAPSGHVLPIREVRLAAGAGFVVALCGDVMTMPGLPRISAAEGMGIDAHGNTYGLA